MTEPHGDEGRLQAKKELLQNPGRVKKLFKHVLRPSPAVRPSSVKILHWPIKHFLPSSFGIDSASVLKLNDLLN